MEQYRIDRLVAYIYDQVDKSDNKEVLKDSISDVLRHVLVPQTTTAIDFKQNLDYSILKTNSTIGTST